MVSTALQVLLLLTFYILRTTQAEDFVCPPGASLDLSNAERNASGFVSKSWHVFPENKTRIVDGMRRGCICDLKPCLAICPPDDEEPGKTYVVDDYANYTAIPKVKETNGTLDEEANALGPQKWFHILVWDPCPDFASYDITHDMLEVYLLREGSLFLPKVKNPDKQIKGFGTYCLGLIDNETNYIPRVCSSEKNYEDEDEDETELEFPEGIENAQYIGRLVTVPFIVATIIVYSVLPRLKNIHGTTLRCYLGCLIVTNVALPLDRIPHTDSESEGGPWCLSLGFIIYFSILSGFLWLNVMCLDLWWRFGGCGPFRSTAMKKDRKKFIWYSIYVWGMSVLITAICIGMEFIPGIPESVIRPEFTSGKCWFRTEKAKQLYYICPISLIIFCNIALFISTTIKLVQHKKKTRRDFNSKTSRRHNHKNEWFGLHLRLCVAMGVCWSMEVIAEVWEGPTYLFAVTDMINALQGILIFIIFVCKKSIWMSLKERYGKRKLGASQGLGAESKFKRSISQFSNSSRITPQDTITRVSTISDNE